MMKTLLLLLIAFGFCSSGVQADPPLVESDLYESRMDADVCKKAFIPLDVGPYGKYISMIPEKYNNKKKAGDMLVFLKEYKKSWQKFCKKKSLSSSKNEDFSKLYLKLDYLVKNLSRFWMKIEEEKLKLNPNYEYGSKFPDDTKPDQFQIYIMNKIPDAIPGLKALFRTETFWKPISGTFGDRVTINYIINHWGFMDLRHFLNQADVGFVETTTWALSEDHRWDDCINLGDHDDYLRYHYGLEQDLRGSMHTKYPYEPETSPTYRRIYKKIYDNSILFYDQMIPSIKKMCLCYRYGGSQNLQNLKKFRKKYSREAEQRSISLQLVKDSPGFRRLVTPQPGEKFKFKRYEECTN